MREIRETFASRSSPNQGVLLLGSLIGLDGNRALIATRVEGVLAATVDADLVSQFLGLVEIAMYTSGRFLWSAVLAANPAFVFDEVADLYLSKGITLEPVFSGAGNRWIGRPWGGPLT